MTDIELACKKIDKVDY